MAEPRGERRAVQQVAGVEEEREHDDRQPRQPRRDVAHGGELGRAGERDDAHRAPPRAASSPRRGPPARTRGRSRSPRRAMPGGIEESRLRAARRSALTPRLPEERLRAGPVADDVDGVELVPRTRRRGAAPGSPRSGTSRPTSGPSRRAASTPRRACRRGLAGGDERRDARRALRLGLARVRVVLADVRGHAPLREGARKAGSRSV